MAAALIFYVRVPKTRRYMPLIFTAAVLVSGAVGNFIDRMAHRYVVDFIYFSVIDFRFLTWLTSMLPFLSSPC